MTMDCRRWLELCDEWRDGRLDAAAARACRDHAAACPDCAEILDLLEDSLGAESIAAPDLTAEILAATSGAACDRARLILGEDPGSAPEALLAGHLEHCSACRELARILAWLPDTLAEMAEATPDTAFAYDVLRATTTPRARRRAGAWPRLRERAAAWWEGQLRRPQFAWEAAWVATVLAVLIFATPLSPGRETSRRALAVVEASPGWVLQQSGSFVGETGLWLADRAADLDARSACTAPFRADLRRHALELGTALLDADAATARNRLASLGRDAQYIWKTWGASPAPTESMHETNRDGS